MKRKILLTMLILSLFVCLFVVGVSAASTNEFGTVETVNGMSEKSVFGADGTAEGYTTRVVLFDGNEYHTYPSYYIFTNNVNTTTNFKELNDATGKSYGKKSVIRVEVPHNVKKVTGDVFNSYNDLKYVLFPDTLTEISGNMFYTSHGLEWVNVPRDCTFIGGYAFYGCSSLVTIDMSNAKSLKKTEANQFYNCPKLEELVFPEGFEYFGGAGGGGQTFQNGLGSLKKLYLPNSVTYMGTISEMKAIGTFTVPLGITTLKSNQFSYCTGLNKIVIHKNMTSIDSNAFNMTFYLKEFVYTGDENDSVINDMKKYNSPNHGAATITFANHCEYYFNNVHDVAYTEGNFCSGICNNCGAVTLIENPVHKEIATLVFGENKSTTVDFYAVMSEIFVCEYCETERTVLYGAMFEKLGYSADEEDTTSITYETIINHDAVEKYEEVMGIELKYGLIASANPSVSPITSVGDDGEIALGALTVNVSMTGTIYKKLSVIVRNLSSNTQALNCCGYVVEGTKVTYLGNTSASEEAEIISHADIVAK